MAKVVVIGFPGDDQLYLADLDSKTIEPLETPEYGPLADANELRNSGAPVVKDVNLAVAVSSSQPAFAGVFD